MGVTSIPLTTLPANAVIDSSVIPALTQPVGTFTDFQLLLNRNVGAASLDTTPTAQISVKAEWSDDGGVTWKPGLSAMVGGGLVFKDKTQTIRQEQFGLDWPFGSNFPTATHIRGTVVNGPVTVSVSGTATLS